MQFLREKGMVLLLILVYLLVVLRTAWMSDDAYITLRTVDHFVNGYGLVWNIGERVQAYTHPLWMLLLSGFFFITREPYFTSLFLSIGIDLLAVWIFCRRAAISNRTACFGMVLLVFSKPFIDYSTSGLENPLTYLLLVVFFVLYIHPERNSRRIFLLTLLAALGGLNRLDLLLIFMPPLLYALFVQVGEGKRRSFLYFLAGLSPLVLWLVFSLIYYGFPFPNTAYAKLNTSIPTLDLISQGFLYYFDSFLVDPLTLLTISACFLVGIIRPQKRLIPVLVGMALYLLYILRIGGDFMSGRLFAPVFLVAVLLLSQVEWRFRSRPLLAYAFAAVLLVELISPYSTLRSGPNYRANVPIAEMINEWGIADERGFYYQDTGLLHARLDASSPHLNNWVVKQGLDLREAGAQTAALTMIGMPGFYAGPQVIIIDRMALADPFLARLPYTPEGKWRIGHFERALPCGYIETVQSGTNQLVDPGLAAYYDRLKVVISGPIFSLNRLHEIWDFNTGRNDGLLKGYNPKIDCVK